MLCKKKPQHFVHLPWVEGSKVVETTNSLPWQTSDDSFGN